MNKTVINNFTLIENLCMPSPSFVNKVSTNFIGFYSNDNTFNLNDNSSEADIVEQLSNEMNCNPDGWLVFIHKEFEKSAKDLIKNELIKSFNLDELNFTNGDFSESILFHKIEDGLILEMIDPECFSPFLENLVVELRKIDKNLLAFDVAHISSHICDLNISPNGQMFLDILNKNSIGYSTE